MWEFQSCFTFVLLKASDVEKPVGNQQTSASKSLAPGGRRSLGSVKWSIINYRPLSIIAKQMTPSVSCAPHKKEKGGPKTPFTARLEACTRQKTAKNATELTLHSTYTSTSISGIFSVACHRREATTDAASAPAPAPPPLPPPPPRCLMHSQDQEPQDATDRLCCWSSSSLLILFLLLLFPLLLLAVRCIVSFRSHKCDSSASPLWAGS